MKMQPCRCCEDNKAPLKSGSGGYSYNRVYGKDLDWMRENGETKSEFTVPVKGGKRFSGEDWQKAKCGDGSMGFSTRRKGQDEVNMEVGMDGQFKKKRKTLVRPKSARCSASRRTRRIDGSKCGLASSVEIRMAARDPVVVAQQERVYKKTIRKEKLRGVNRHKARRAAKRNQRAQMIDSVQK